VRPGEKMVGVGEDSENVEGVQELNMRLEKG